jgi:hypothetical protein
LRASAWLKAKSFFVDVKENFLSVRITPDQPSAAAPERRGRREGTLNAQKVVEGALSSLALRFQGLELPSQWHESSAKME